MVQVREEKKNMTQAEFSYSMSSALLLDQPFIRIFPSMQVQGWLGFLHCYFMSSVLLLDHPFVGICPSVQVQG